MIFSERLSKISMGGISVNQVYIDLVINAILEQFKSEQDFCENYLGISTELWNQWKHGQGQLPPELTQKIKNLFSDYEWMLSQKVIRQTILFPEKRTTAVAEYRELKTIIAQKWLASGIAEVEMVPFKNQNEEEHHEYIDLRVTIDYGKWGYDDIISFRLPAQVQKQIESSKTETALLDWVNQNLTEAYTSAEEE